MTAEEFFKRKLKELQPTKTDLTLSQESITAEQGMKWAKEFKDQSDTIAENLEKLRKEPN